PLLLRVPGARGARVAARVRLADLAPTLLAAAGVDAPSSMQGESMLPLAQGRDARDRPAYSETGYPRQAFGWSPLVAWRADRFLLVRAPRSSRWKMGRSRRRFRCSSG